MADNSPGQVKANIAARQASDALLTFAADVLREYDDADELRFWELVAEAAAAKTGKVLAADGPKAEPMSDDEAAKFEASAVPWGQYAGRKVRDVPAEYWLTVTEGHFRRQLGRYLSSARWRRLTWDA